MLRQTPEQKQNPELKQFGAHTVGAPDGGPGLPVANWSENHGDLRVAHFIGLHGMQIIPLIGWWLLRRKRLSEQQRTRLVWLVIPCLVLTFLFGPAGWLLYAFIRSFAIRSVGAGNGRDQWGANSLA